MGMFDSRKLEVSLATIAAVVTTGAVSLTDDELRLVGHGSSPSEQISQLAVPKPIMSSGGITDFSPKRVISVSAEEQSASEEITLKMLGLEPPTAEQEEQQKAKLTHDLEAKLGGKLRLEPVDSESLEAYKKRAEERSRDIFEIRSVVPVTEKPWSLNIAENETLDSFAYRVLGKPEDRGKAVLRHEDSITEDRAWIKAMNQELLHERGDQAAAIAAKGNLSFEEQKAVLTKSLERMIRTELRLETPASAENFEDFKKRAEQRALALSRLGNMDRSATWGKDESFEDFSDRVTVRFYRDEQAHKLRIQELVKSLSGEK